MTYMEFIEKIKECEVIQDIHESGDRLTERIFMDMFKVYFGDSVILKSGATKGVIIPKDADFVIKIPFEAYNCGDNFNEDDYCQLEATAYENALIEGFEFVFVETKFVDIIDGIKIYVQPRVDEYARDEDEEYLSCDESNEMEDLKDSYFSAYDMNSYWLYEFINVYGMDIFNDFCHFTEEYGINDLHGGNLGYYHGKPVIFDYSGYFE